MLRQAILALNARGEEAVLFVGSEGRGCLETAAVPIHRYWYRRSRFRIVTLFTFLISQWMLYRALSRSRLPEDAIIYVNTLLPFGAMIWGRRNGRAVLCHIHEVSISPSPLKRFLVSVAAWAGSRAIYVSEDNLSRLPIPGLQSTVVANPVAPEIARAAAATPYSPRRSGYFEVLMLASPRDFKGVPEYIELARRLEARTDIAFTLVLNGNAQEVARYLPASQRPKNTKVHARTDTPGDFYATADLLLNLSRPDQWIETFGLTLIEGMAFGLPVIAPPVGGPTEIVTENQEGYLCDGRDQDRLANIVEGLADNPDVANRLSQAARLRAAEYTLESFATGLAAQLAVLRTTERAT
ncbi:glycosyltransferase family 4 protein [Roseibacterium sp. SDUM158016]|uniref:glycosyltransferase family 4 protein n=1 Tax=Roseicyclus sediminis TaxID=2980997 RepID=UPI0021D11B04|nr:glycosyltransferase family 4 protein [Roseibacterium sp. SDUM158016]MCU4653762.1 glycosyltransferase family 4 protein [Roseibacterium sp. SDUM158016]